MAIQPVSILSSGADVQPRLPPGAMSMNAGQPQASESPGSMKCYLVEDSLVIRQNLIATLEEMLAVQVVGSAEDENTATAWLRGPEPCDLMIIDVFLKSGTGLQVLHLARLLRPQAKLVVLTNFATPAMRRHCLQLGADRVFDKSAELEELLAYCEALAAGR